MSKTKKGKGEARTNAKRQAAFVARRHARGLVRVSWWVTATERVSVDQLLEKLRRKKGDL